ncbi:MAG: hypothetical protein HYY37_01565 [Candidatus Aenigmarchaeota archaeon]|nr:hypothetical protein [Candidatus Aenigmarchaeota archaeon]
MKLRKSFHLHDERARVFSRIVDTVIPSFTYLNFNGISISLCEKDAIELSDDAAKIHVNYYRREILEKDERAISIVLISSLLKAELRKVMQAPAPVEDVFVSRKIAKTHQQDLFYYWYLSLLYHQPKIATMEAFIGINIPWLSFYGIDDYDAEFLMNMVSRFSYPVSYEAQAKELFVLLSGRLSLREVAAATSAYERVVSCNS